MKKHILIILFAFACCFAAKAQFTVGYSAGYGTFNMNDMQSLMDSRLVFARLATGGVPVQITSNFPGRATHTIDLGYRIKKHEVGLKGTYLTSGGRISYSDYSGEYIDELTANGYRVAAMYRYYVPLYTKKQMSLQFYGEVSPGITFSSLKSDGHLKTGKDVKPSGAEAVDTNVSGFTLLPQIGLKFYLTRWLALHVSTGYDFEFGAKVDDLISAPRVDWSGFRVNGGISVSL